MRPAGDTIEPILKGRLKAGPATLIGATANASCGPTGAVVLAGAAPASFVYSNKLPSDYLAEFASGAACNTLNALKDRGLWRPESFDPAVYERPMYRHRTLGQTACHDKKDPSGRSSTRVRQGMESPHQWPM